MNKQILKFLAGFCIVTMPFVSLNVEASKTHPETLDKIVAVVNDSIISQSEFNLALQNIKKQLEVAHAPIPSQDVLKKRVLDQLIDRKVQLLVVEQSGAKVSDDQINKAIYNIATQNKMTAKELYAKVAEQGISPSAYKKEIREELLVQQIQQQEIGSKISITPQEVDDFMRSASWKSFHDKEYHLEDILVALPESPTPTQVAEAKKEAEVILSKAHQGKSFSQIALDEIGNPSLQTGDLGWLKLPQIPPVFSNDLVNMKTNEILGPVPTPNGFHIIRLAGIRNVTSKEDKAGIRKQVEQLIFQRKLTEGLQSWTKKLRSESFIKTQVEV